MRRNVAPPAWLRTRQYLSLRTPRMERLSQSPTASLRSAAQARKNDKSTWFVCEGRVGITTNLVSARRTQNRAEPHAARTHQTDPSKRQQDDTRQRCEVHWGVAKLFVRKPMTQRSHSELAARRGLLDLLTQLFRQALQRRAAIIDGQVDVDQAHPAVVGPSLATARRRTRLRCALRSRCRRRIAR